MPFVAKTSGGKSSLVSGGVGYISPGKEAGLEDLLLSGKLDKPTLLVAEVRRGT